MVTVNAFAHIAAYTEEKNDARTVINNKIIQ